MNKMKIVFFLFLHIFRTFITSIMSCVLYDDDEENSLQNYFILNHIPNDNDEISGAGERERERVRESESEKKKKPMNISPM